MPRTGRRVSQLVAREGVAYKSDTRGRRWNERFFTLDDTHQLRYFTSREASMAKPDKALKGTVDLSAVQPGFLSFSSLTGKGYAKPPTDHFCTLQVGTRPFQMCFENEATLDVWVGFFRDLEDRLFGVPPERLAPVPPPSTVSLHGVEVFVGGATGASDDDSAVRAPSPTAAAVAVQKTWRGVQGRRAAAAVQAQRAVAQNHAAARIQAIARGSSGRRAAAERRQVVEERRRQLAQQRAKDLAARQRGVEAMKARIKREMEEQAAREAVLQFQQRTALHKPNKAAVAHTIQTWYRRVWLHRRQAALEAQENELEVEEAAGVIQGLYHIRRAKKEASRRASAAKSAQSTQASAGAGAGGGSGVGTSSVATTDIEQPLQAPKSCCVAQ